MIELLFFISGIIFYSVIAPLFESITAYILSWIEAKKAEVINSVNLKIQKDALTSADETTIKVTGFASNLQEEEEDDE